MIKTKWPAWELDLLDKSQLLPGDHAVSELGCKQWALSQFHCSVPSTECSENVILLLTHIQVLKEHSHMIAAELKTPEILPWKSVVDMQHRDEAATTSDYF